MVSNFSNRLESKTVVITIVLFAALSWLFIQIDLLVLFFGAEHLEQNQENGFWMHLALAAGIASTVGLYRRYQVADARLKFQAEDFAQFSLLKDLFKTVPNILLITNRADARLVEVNINGCNRLGYERSELLSKTVMEISSRIRSWEEWERLMARLETQSNEIMLIDDYRTVDQAVIPVEASISLHRIEGKELILIAARDISETLRQAEVLKESEKRFRGLVENTNDWIWEMDIRGVCTYSSPSAEKMLGYSTQEVEGLDLHNLFIEEDKPAARENLKQAIMNREAFGNIELTMLHKNGRRVVVEASGKPFFSDAGELLGFRGVGRDVTERKKQEKLFEKITNATFDGIVTIDERARILTWNQACEEIFGYGEKEVLGQQIHHLLTPESIRDRADQGHHHYTETGDGPIVGKTQELPALTKSGKEIPVELAVTAMEHEGKWYAIGTLRDLSETKRLQEENIRQEEMLITQSRLAAMGEMIGNIAHQWRQPISSIGMAVQNIQNAYEFGTLDGEYLERRVPKIVEQIDFMSKTIDDFRNFFRPNREKTVFSLQENVEKAMEIVQGSYQHHNIAIGFHRGDVPLYAKGYPNEFSQVLMNVLQNARDVLVEREVQEPRVTITLFEENGSTVVSIEDNAGGIPPDVLDRVFEPYFTTKGPEVGTGIGLYMSKIIVEKHMQGSIRAENSDQGARFLVCLDKTEAEHGD